MVSELGLAGGLRDLSLQFESPFVDLKVHELFLVCLTLYVQVWNDT